jgi:hypothetical protein
LDDRVANKTRRISCIDRSCVGKVDAGAAEKVDVAIVVLTLCWTPAMIKSLTVPAPNPG